MGYKSPEEVISPKNRWRHVRTLCNTGQGGFSVVDGRWDGEACIGIRWNGDDLSGNSGTPQSTGWPTWFILPNELGTSIREASMILNNAIRCIRCNLSQPEGFTPEVYQVEIEIVDPTLLNYLNGKNLEFQLPVLTSRLFRELDIHQGKYFAPPQKIGSNWQGKLVDGKWMGIVQSNGVLENQNKTTKYMVHDALIAQLANALIQYCQGLSSLEQIFCTPSP